MKLSELKPDQVSILDQGEEQPDAPLRLSDLDKSQVTVLQKERGPQVYDKPIGPEQDSFIDRAKERIQDPARWQAILTNKGPYANKDLVQGDVPLAIPAGAPIAAAGKIAELSGDAGKVASTAMRAPEFISKAATALNDGKGIGYALGRTGLATAQGAGMSAFSGPDDESLSDKLDRMKSGAKLSGGIQLAVESLPYVGKAAGWAARKLGNAGTNISDDLIKNYSERTDKVNDLIKQSGGDMTAAADQVRTELSDGIQGAKKQLNNQISTALKDAPQEASVSIDPILQRLKAARDKLNPNLKADAVADIDEMISRVTEEASKTNADGLVNHQQLYELKQYLGENSKGAYNKGGQIFTRASEAARAAKDAGADARELVKINIPEISQADSHLSKLHAIEGRLNKNLLAAGKPDGALMAAGAGTNARNAANLRTLEQISGVPVMQRAKDLATAREFAKPSLLPTDATGKAVARMALGAGLGGLLDGEKGAAIGGAIASPMALKLGINAANIAKVAANASKVPAVADFIKQNPAAAHALIQTAFNHIYNVNSSPDQQPSDEMNTKPVLGDYGNETDRKPAAKGEEKWASQGAQKLGLDQDSIDRAMQSKQGKALLIQASDLKPGHPSLERIKKKIGALK